MRRGHETHSRRSVLQAIGVGLLGGGVALFAEKAADDWVGGTTRFNARGEPFSIKSPTNRETIAPSEDVQVLKKVCDSSNTAMDEFTMQCEKPGTSQLPQIPNIPELPKELPKIPALTDNDEIIVTGPAKEELEFRALFSLAANILEGRKSWFMDTIAGSADAPITPIDVGGSLLSSALFALSHNGANAQRGIRRLEPHAGEAVGGLIFWALARNFGLVSSYVAHSTYNAVVMFVRKLPKR